LFQFEKMIDFFILFILKIQLTDLKIQLAAGSYSAFYDAVLRP